MLREICDVRIARRIVRIHGLGVNRQVDRATLRCGVRPDIRWAQRKVSLLASNAYLHIGSLSYVPVLLVADCFLAQDVLPDSKVLLMEQ